MDNKDFKFIDIHCHYDLLNGEYLKTIFPKENIVALTNNVSLESFERLEKLKLKNLKNLFFAYGLYPDCVLRKPLEANLNDIERVLGNNSYVALGEIGLDYKITKAQEKRAEQKIVFERQLALAKERKLPVVIHSRYATKPVLDILECWDGFPVILHWFSGTGREIDMALNKGYYLSFRFGSPQLQSVADCLSQILIETDYPVMYSGRELEITDIMESYKLFAKKYNLTMDELKSVVQTNFLKLFPNINI